MHFKSFGFSDAGRTRKRNEDSYLCNEGQGLFLVTDGMGGHASGEVASQLAIDSFEEFVIRSRSEDVKWPIPYRSDLSREQNRLLNATILSDRKIRELGEKDPSMKGMGTTLVGVIIEDDALAIVNVGDSRMYRIQNGSIDQITVDHTLANEQEKNGIISKYRAKNHPNRHILTNALGHIDNPSKIDISKIQIKENDLYLICSDGLYNMLNDHKILLTIQAIKDKSLYKMGLSLLLEANLAGGLDNITVVLISFN